MGHSQAERTALGSALFSRRTHVQFVLSIYKQAVVEKAAVENSAVLAASSYGSSTIWLSWMSTSSFFGSAQFGRLDPFDSSDPFDPLDLLDHFAGDFQLRTPSNFFELQAHFGHSVVQTLNYSSWHSMALGTSGTETPTLAHSSHSSHRRTAASDCVRGIILCARMHTANYRTIQTVRTTSCSACFPPVVCARHYRHPAESPGRLHSAACAWNARRMLE